MMNTSGLNFMRVNRRTCCGNRAMTLPEIMVVMAIFSLVMIVLVSSQLFGLRMYKISETKLVATASGRKSLNQLRNDIRSGKLLAIGNGDSASFTPVADDSPQIGDALQINPTTNLAAYIRYYLDTNNAQLKRVTSVNTNVEVLASFITNRLVFQAEDFRGNVLTNHQNNRVVRLTLEFYRWEYPIAMVGQDGMYDYYRLQTRVTRRLIE